MSDSLKRTLVKIVNVLKLKSNQSLEGMNFTTSILALNCSLHPKKEKCVNFPNVSELSELKCLIWIMLILKIKYDAHKTSGSKMWPAKI